MVKIGTSCSDCCFFDEEFNCSNNLLEIFKERNAEITTDSSGIIIDRVCLYERSLDWNNDKTLSEKIEIVNQETYVTGTIVLITDNEEEFKNTITSLKNISNFKVIILHKNIKPGKLLEICGTLNISYKCIIMATNDIEMQIYMSLKHAKNGYLFIVDCSKQIDSNIIDKFNNFVNKKMFRVLYVNGTEGLHCSVSMIHLYKWIKGDIDIPMSEKILDISSQENSDPQIFTWKEIDEEYKD